MEENLKADEKINGDDQIKAEESTPTMTEPKKETLEELELSKTNNQLTKKLAMFENTLKSVQNDIVIPLKERITRLELEKKGSHFLFFKLKMFYSYTCPKPQNRPAILRFWAQLMSPKTFWTYFDRHSVRPSNDVCAEIIVILFSFSNGSPENFRWAKRYQSGCNIQK